MFADVTARETGRQTATRALYLLGSTGLQGILVAALVLATLVARPPPEQPPVPIGQPVILPSRPPAAPRPASQPAPRLARPTPPRDTIVQPVDVPPVAATEPGPPDPAPVGDGPADPDFVPGTAPIAGGNGAGGVTEETLYAQAGFRAPALAQRLCVQQGLRVPRDLAGFVSGPVTVKFAVGRDGTPARFSTLTGGVPDRIAAAIWQAVQDCRWVAGADPSGQPVSLWVVMPLRFAAE
ncbi:MAG: hypothetical protein QM704_13510 [Anaeromyxobacteraceae bacterium]